MGKLTLYVEVLSVKQNLGLVRLLESQALGKLTLYVEVLSLNQNLGLVRLLRSQALGKLIVLEKTSKCRPGSRFDVAPRVTNHE